MIKVSQTKRGEQWLHFPGQDVTKLRMRVRSHENTGMKNTYPNSSQAPFILSAGLQCCSLLCEKWKLKSHSSGNMLAEQNVSQLLWRGKTSDSVPFHSCSKLSICVICREERSAYVDPFIIAIFMSSLFYGMDNIPGKRGQIMWDCFKYSLVCPMKLRKRNSASSQEQKPILILVLVLSLQVSYFSDNLKRIELFSFSINNALNQVHYLWKI